jgi:hypothetical protein
MWLFKTSLLCISLSYFMTRVLGRPGWILSALACPLLTVATLNTGQ